MSARKLELKYTSESLDTNHLKSDLTLLLLVPSGAKKATTSDYGITRKFNKLDQEIFKGKYNIFSKPLTRGKAYLKGVVEGNSLKVLLLCIQKSRNEKVTIGDTSNDRIKFLKSSIKQIVKSYPKLKRIVGDYNMFQPYLDQLDDLVKTYRLENQVDL